MLKSPPPVIVAVLTLATLACTTSEADDTRAVEPSDPSTSASVVAATTVASTTPPSTGSEGGLAFGLERCGPMPASWATANPAFYRSEPAYIANDQPLETIRAWARQQPAYEDIWIDQRPLRWVAVGFTEDVNERQRDLEEMFPDIGAVAVEVAHGRDELEALHDEVIDALTGSVSSWGLYASVPAEHVVVDLGVLDRATLAPLAPFAGRPICVNGADASQAVPDRPQPTEGDGWRLLGYDTVGLGYRTGVATTPDQYEAVWRLAGLDEPAPAVDFQTEIVVWFGSVFGGGCEHRLDDVIVLRTRGIVYGRFLVPGPPAVCNADANPKAYVVAVDRASLPDGPFMVQLNASDPPGGAPEERTVVDVGLTEPGSVAIDAQIGFDPAVDEPWRIDLVDIGGEVTPKVPFTYALWSDCPLVAVGPINDIVWTSDVRPDWENGVFLPVEWTEGLGTNEPAVMTGVITADESSLTMERNGLAVTFDPAPPGVDSICH